MTQMLSIDVERAYTLYWEEGYTLQEIADIEGVSRMTVSARLREHGIPTRGSLHFEGEFDLNEAVRLYEGEGYSLAQVGARLGVSDHKVKNELLAAGHRIRGQHEYYANEPSRKRKERDESSHNDISSGVE